MQASSNSKFVLLQKPGDEPTTTNTTTANETVDTQAEDITDPESEDVT